MKYLIMLSGFFLLNPCFAQEIKYGVLTQKAFSDFQEPALSSEKRLKGLVVMSLGHGSHYTLPAQIEARQVILNKGQERFVSGVLELERRREALNTGGSFYKLKGPAVILSPASYREHEALNTQRFLTEVYKKAGQEAEQYGLKAAEHFKDLTGLNEYNFSADPSYEIKYRFPGSWAMFAGVGNGGGGPYRATVSPFGSEEKILDEHKRQTIKVIGYDQEDLAFLVYMNSGDYDSASLYWQEAGMSESEFTKATVWDEIYGISKEQLIQLEEHFGKVQAIQFENSDFSIYQDLNIGYDNKMPFVIGFSANLSPSESAEWPVYVVTGGVLSHRIKGADKSGSIRAWPETKDRVLTEGLMFVAPGNGGGGPYMIQMQ